MSAGGWAQRFLARFAFLLGFLLRQDRRQFQVAIQKYETLGQPRGGMCRFCLFIKH